MAKYKLFVDETRSFRHEIEVETELNENELDKKLTEIEDEIKLDSLFMVKYELAKAGLYLTKTKIDQLGTLGEMKIEEMEEIEECN